MVDFIVKDTGWCALHGHPYLMLQSTDGERHVAVAITVDDAQAIAPVAATPSGVRAHATHGLLDIVFSNLGIQVTRVDMALNADGTLCAAIGCEGPRFEMTVPAHFVDGVMIAQRRALPLRLHDQDIDRVSVDGRAASRSKPEPPRAFKDFIASLDFDDNHPDNDR